MLKKFITALFIFLSTAVTSHADRHSHSIKCGTPEVLMRLFSGKAKIADIPRPTIGTTLGTSVLSSEDHFRVHFDTTGYHKPDMTDSDSNGIPDYVDSTLVFLEYAWDVMIDTLGYNQPLSDNGTGGGDEVDFYIKEFGEGGGYGVTYPEQASNGSAASYCIIDNDFAEEQYKTHGYAALKVTTAHEFFHTIHFRYKYGYQLIWWMEQSAVWMEERAWDDVNDYLAYLKYFFGSSKKLPLDESNRFFEYGATIWAMFLAKRFGDDQIRIIWETLRDSSNPHIADFDDALKKGTSGGTGLPEALAEFAVWNYFTRERANTRDFYHDSDLFDVLMDSDLYWNFSPAADSLSIINLTNRYIELLFVGDWNKNDLLSVRVLPRDGGSCKSSVLFYNDPYDYYIHPVEQHDDPIPLSKPWEKAVLIITCTNTNNHSYLFAIEAEISASNSIASSPLYAFALQGAYPNPFNPATTIAFSLSQPEQVSVSVFNAGGQKVADVFNGFLSAGEKRILWKPSNLAGGVYFIKVTTPGESKTTKVLLLK